MLCDSNYNIISTNSIRVDVFRGRRRGHMTRRHLPRNLVGPNSGGGGTAVRPIGDGRYIPARDKRRGNQRRCACSIVTDSTLTTARCFGGSNLATHVCEVNSSDGNYNGYRAAGTRDTIY